MDTRDIKSAIAQFVYDALRDQDQLHGHKIEITPINKSITQVKVWPRDLNRPPEYFTVQVTHNQ